MGGRKGLSEWASSTPPDGDVKCGIGRGTTDPARAGCAGSAAQQAASAQEASAQHLACVAMAESLHGVAAGAANATPCATRLMATRAFTRMRRMTRSIRRAPSRPGYGSRSLSWFDHTHTAVSSPPFGPATRLKVLYSANAVSRLAGLSFLPIT